MSYEGLVDVPTEVPTEDTTIVNTHSDIIDAEASISSLDPDENIDDTGIDYDNVPAQRPREKPEPVVFFNELTPDELADFVAIMDPDAYPDKRIRSSRMRYILDKVAAGGAVLDKDEARFLADPGRNDDPYDRNQLSTTELWAIIQITEGVTPTCSDKLVRSALRKIESGDFISPVQESSKMPDIEAVIENAVDIVSNAMNDAVDDASGVWASIGRGFNWMMGPAPDKHNLPMQPIKQSANYNPVPDIDYTGKVVGPPILDPGLRNRKLINIVDTVDKIVPVKPIVGVCHIVEPKKEESCAVM